MLKHPVLLYFDLVFNNAFSSGIFLAVKLVYLQSPYPNSLCLHRHLPPPILVVFAHSRGSCKVSKGFVNHTNAFLHNGWSSVPMTCLSILFPCHARQ